MNNYINKYEGTYITMIFFEMCNKLSVCFLIIHLVSYFYEEKRALRGKKQM